MQQSNLILNRTWLADLKAASTPCFALGLAELNGRLYGICALKPDRDIPYPMLKKGISIGHGVLGMDRSVMCYFGVRFDEFAFYTALINPAKPILRPILSTMAETGSFLFMSLSADNTATAFGLTSDSFDVERFRTNLLAMRDATTSDQTYYECYQTLQRTPTPTDAELVTWTCRHNPDYLDLSDNIAHIQSLPA